VLEECLDVIQHVHIVFDIRQMEDVLTAHVGSSACATTGTAEHKSATAAVKSEFGSIVRASLSKGRSQVG
jgi:hypothetical protein